MKRLILLVAVLALLAPALAQTSGLKATFDTLWVRVFDGETCAMNAIRAKLDTWATPPKWWIMQYADSVAGAGLVIYRGYGFADSLALIATGDTLRLDSALIAGGSGGTTDSFKLYYGLTSTASDSWLRPDSAVWLDTTTLDSRYSVTDKFTHNDPADSSETLYAKTGVFDTTAAYAGAALSVAGNARVRDTVVTRSACVAETLEIGRNQSAASSGVILLAPYLTEVAQAKITNDRIVVWDSSFSGGGELRSASLYCGATLAEVRVKSETSFCLLSSGVNGIPKLEIIGGKGLTYACTTRVDSNHIHTNGWITGDDSLRSARITATTSFVGPGAVVPGTVIEWYGDSSAFPAGYVLCDGTRKFKTATGESLATPDLRNKFVVGASIDTGNGIPMSSIEDTTGAAAKATGGTVKYTPAGDISSHVAAEGEHFATVEADGKYSDHTMTGTRAVLVQPYVALWRLIYSRQY